MSRFIAILLGSACALTSFDFTWGSIQTGDNVQLRVWNNTGVFHTPFRLTGPADDFLTFCVERTEYFSSSGSNFTVTGVSEETNRTSYFLSGYSAWVYNEFRLRFPSLTPSSSVPTLFTTVISGGFTLPDLFQIAIWSGMLKHDLAHPTLSTYTTASIGGSQSQYVVNSTIAAALDSINLGVAAFNSPSNTSWGGITQLHGYKVANFDIDGYWGQDQLLPPGPQVPPNNNNQPVPEPTTLASFGALMLIGLAWRHRHRAQVKYRS